APRSASMESRGSAEDRLEETIMWYSAIGCIVTLILSLLTTPHAADAQPPAQVPRIGFLRPDSPSTAPSRLAAFREGLRELGYVEGQNIAIEYRWAEGRFERLPDLVADLVRLPVDIIVTTGPPAVRAAQHATSTIPIVVTVMHEPVAMGFVVSLARPGGNIT